MGSQKGLSPQGMGTNDKKLVFIRVYYKEIVKR